MAHEYDPIEAMLTGVDLPQMGDPASERCRGFMDKQGWKKLERLANGQDEAAKRPDLMIHAMRLLCAYGYGRPPKLKASK